MSRLLLTVLCGLVLWSSCSDPKRDWEWQYVQTIALDTVSPIGIDFDGIHYWLSDGENSQVLKMDANFQVKDVLDGFDRPMHLDAAADGRLYIPEYGSDNIVVIDGNNQTLLELKHDLDAPAGIDIAGDQIAIADFYNHRVLYYDGTEWTSLGSKGVELGQLHYPTDVSITDDLIVVADAYNNRIQTFSKESSASLHLIGVEEEMNAATGLFVYENKYFSTDFENSRILEFRSDGMLQRTVEGELKNPADLVVVDDQMAVVDFSANAIVIYKLKPKESS